MINIFRNLKNQGELVLFIIFTVVFLIATYQINNNFTYPDSFLYLSNNFFSTNYNLGLVEHKTDIFVALKPFSVLFIQIVDYGGINIKLFNILFLIFSFFILSKAALKLNPKLRVGLIISFAFYFFNGNTFYWLSRFSAEYLGILLISMIIFSLVYKKNILFFVVYTLLILTRFEFFILLPIILWVLELKKLHKIAFYILVLAYAFLVCLKNEALPEFITHITLPFIFVLAFTEIANYKKNFVDYLIKKQNALKIMFLILAPLVILSLMGFDFTNVIQGNIYALIIMCGVYFTFIYVELNSFKDNRKLNITLLISILMLLLAYSITSETSFRYWLYLMPIMTFIVMANWNESENSLYMPFFFILAAIQVLIIIFLLPWSSLKSNYWIDRIKALKQYNFDDYKIYSSTPLITHYLGYTKSGDVCNFTVNEIDEFSVFIIDGKSSSDCPEAETKIKALGFEEHFLYEKEGIIEIGNKEFDGDTSKFYVDFYSSSFSE